MKTLPTIAISLLLMLAAATPAATELASVLLQEGLYAEEIEGDLDAAIKIYEKIIAQAEQTQQTAALAMYRIGICHLKKGDKTQAANQFQQFIEKFPGQKAILAKVHSQLAKIQPAAAGRFGPVIERVVYSEDSGKAFFFDLDAVKAFSPPEGLIRNSSPQEVMAWGRKNGIDLVNDRGEFELADMIAVNVSNRLWDSATPAEISGKLKNASAINNLPTSLNTTYAFKTREGGSGILQILEKKDNNLRIRYKMLSDTALAARLKGSLYEHLPNDVLMHVAGKYGSISSEAVAKGLYSNSHIYFVEADMTLRTGGIGYYRRSSDQPTGSRIHLSGTSDPDQTLYDIAGRKMNIEIVPDSARARFYHIYWTPSEPIPPGQMFYYGWSSDDARRLSRAPSAATYALIMQNKLGSRGIETFFLIVPAGMEIVDKTEDHTAKETVGGFDIYYWSKEVQPNTSNKIDLLLAPSPGDTILGPVQTATIYDIDNPATKDKHCAIDLDKNSTAGIPATMRSRGNDDVMSYLVGEGVDAVGEFASNEASLIALGMVVEVMPAKAWDRLTPAELTARLSERKVAATETKIMQWNDQGDQSVFAFATREGAMGLIQILSADKKTQRFELRYKMLQKEKAESPIDLSTPEATIKSFVKAVYYGNLEAARACVSKDGHDYDEFKEMLATESNHPFQAMIKAMDVSVPVEITSKSINDGKCKISWYLTLGRVYYFGETKMKKGMHQEFDSYLELVGDKWLIRDI